MFIRKCKCGSIRFADYFNGYSACTNCGLMVGDRPYMEYEYSLCAPLMPRQAYTRRKRFKKYLQRASRNQSVNTVPPDTWKYLIARGPYSCARAILRTLKRSKLKRKCYDSLPLMTENMCPNLSCPLLSQDEQAAAMIIFGTIDNAIKGPFISYVYALEYILVRMNRPDLLPFINQIQCSKRRAAYKRLLDGIFKSCDSPEVSDFERFGFCSTHLDSA